MSSFSSSDSCTRCAARFNIASMVTGSWTPVIPKRNDVTHRDKFAENQPIGGCSIVSCRISESDLKCSNLRCCNFQYLTLILAGIYSFLIRGIGLVYANDKPFPYDEASGSEVVPGLKLFNADMVSGGDLCQSVTRSNRIRQRTPA